MELEFLRLFKNIFKKMIEYIITTTIKNWITKNDKKKKSPKLPKETSMTTISFSIVHNKNY